MTLPSVSERILISLADYVKRDRQTITPAYSLRDDLGLDSMATIELFFRIEEAFEIQIPDEDLHKLVTVGDVIAYVEKKVRPAHSIPAKTKARTVSASAKKSTAAKKGK